MNKTDVTIRAARAAGLALMLLALWAPLRALDDTTDDKIESAAKQTHTFKTYLKDDDIKVDAKDGVVTLTGTVDKESHKSLAQDTVAGLPGVTSVDNRLAVKGANPAAESDMWLADKVRMTLLVHRSVSLAKADVSVKDGNLTLTGRADSQAQKDLTTEYAKDIAGIKNVDNRMTVDKNPKPLAARTDDAIDDASITAQVKMALLFHRSTSALFTKVSTNAGAVTINGVAKNPSEKDLVTKIASDVKGVKSVDNEMTVQMGSKAAD
jgi:osmotically-inducible protein OsmY